MQVSNKINTGPTHPDHPRLFSAHADQVDANSINKPKSGDTPDAEDGDKGTPDVILGVTYKRTSHGITKHTTYEGIQNYLRQRDVHVTQLALLILRAFSQSEHISAARLHY